MNEDDIKINNEDFKPMMSMEDFLQKMEIMYPEYKLEEGEEIIHSFPDSAFASKRKEELMDEIDALVLIEEIELEKKIKEQKHELSEFEKQIQELEKQKQLLFQKIKEDDSKLK